MTDSKHAFDRWLWVVLLSCSPLAGCNDPSGPHIPTSPTMSLNETVHVRLAPGQTKVEAVTLPAGAWVRVFVSSGKEDAFRPVTVQMDWDGHHLSLVTRPVFSIYLQSLPRTLVSQEALATIRLDADGSNEGDAEVELLAAATVPAEALSPGKIIGPQRIFDVLTVPVTAPAQGLFTFGLWAEGETGLTASLQGSLEVRAGTPAELPGVLGPLDLTAGEHGLLIDPQGWEVTFQAAMYAVDPSPETAESTVATGSLIEEDVDVPGDVDVFNVEAPGPGWIRLDAGLTGPAENAATVTLTGFDETLLAGEGAAAGLREVLGGPLPVEDPVTLRWEGARTGRYSFRLAYFSPEPESVSPDLVVGDVVTGEEFELAGEVDTYRLTVSDDVEGFELVLDDPSGTGTLAFEVDADAVFPLPFYVLPQGVYEILVWSEQPGPYELRVVDRNFPDLEPTPIQIGDVLQGQISPDLEVDAFTFPVEEGMTVRVSLTGTEPPPSFDCQEESFGAGVLMDNEILGGAALHLCEIWDYEATAPADGDALLLVGRPDPWTEGGATPVEETFGYTLSVEEARAEIDVPFSGELHHSRDVDIFSFDSEAGVSYQVEILELETPDWFDCDEDGVFAAIRVEPYELGGTGFIDCETETFSVRAGTSGPARVIVAAIQNFIGGQEPPLRSGAIRYTLRLEEVVEIAPPSGSSPPPAPSRWPWNGRWGGAPGPLSPSER